MSHYIMTIVTLMKSLTVKLEICPSVLQQAKNPLAYPNLQLPVAKGMI